MTAFIPILYHTIINGIIVTRHLAAATSLVIPTSALASKGDFETTEINTGYKWIDGKPIYKKTISLGSLPNTSIKDVAHGIQYQRVISLDAIFQDSSNVLLQGYVGGDFSVNIRFLMTVNNISVQTRDNRSSYTGYATVLYTKP